MMFDDARLAQLKKYTFAVYILQGLNFVLPFMAVVGVILNYLKDEEVRGSWLESHFRWQKTTFWYGLLWTFLGVISLPILVGYLVLGGVTVWLIYRIARGWICLVDGKEMYLSARATTSGETHD